MNIEVIQPCVHHVDQVALTLLATGRGSLAFLLGDENTRFRLFSRRINWDRVFLARLDGKAVGFLAFQWAGKGPYAPELGEFVREFGVVSGHLRWGLNGFLESRTRRHGFYVYGLKVIPEARRLGVASALLLAAERHAVRLNAGTVELEVYDTNARALAFYQAQGYQVDGAWRLGVISRWLKFSAILRLAKSLR